jgi:uncharacterized membrane protein
MVMLLKFIHIAAISIWAATLLSLPALYVQRAHVGNRPALYALQRLVRFCYVVVASPAAFVSILTGTALIFFQHTFTLWFTIKLGLIGVMVTVHIVTGLVIIRLFNEGEVYPVWRFIGATVLTAATVLCIFFVVLAKPDWSLDIIPIEAGGLKEIARSISPWAIP